VADRINLGLIPSSEAGWRTACAALKVDTGGILHVHANVTSGRPKTAPMSTELKEQTTDSGTKPRNVCTSNLEKSSSSETDGAAPLGTSDTDNINFRLSKAALMSVELDEMTDSITEPRNLRISSPENFSVSETDDAEPSDICDTVDYCHPHRTSPEECKYRRISSKEKLISKTDDGDPSGSCDVVDIDSERGKTGSDNKTSLRNSRGIDSSAEPAGKICRTARYAKTRPAKPEWAAWADSACDSLRRILGDMLRRDWSVSVLHIEHVKSYAPHVDHVVADIQCRPPT